MCDGERADLIRTLKASAELGLLFHAMSLVEPPLDVAEFREVMQAVTSRLDVYRTGPIEPSDQSKRTDSVGVPDARQFDIERLSACDSVSAVFTNMELLEVPLNGPEFGLVMSAVRGRIRAAHHQTVRQFYVSLDTCSKALNRSPW